MNLIGLKEEVVISFETTTRGECYEQCLNDLRERIENLKDQFQQAKIGEDTYLIDDFKIKRSTSDKKSGLITNHIATHTIRIKLDQESEDTAKLIGKLKKLNEYSDFRITKESAAGGFSGNETMMINV
ncbi:MAG: hypothetical protein N4A72_05065 [Bacteroidales bacterium]|jgi:hypothetical protein|nr:hypothetical protein [Bacteroidales bacterium]